MRHGGRNGLLKGGLALILMLVASAGSAQNQPGQSGEPPADDQPLLAPELLALPNFLLTPHVAWSSRPAMQALADQLIDNIEAFVAGSPKNVLA